jgi:hypothetical protein
MEQLSVHSIRFPYFASKEIDPFLLFLAAISSFTLLAHIPNLLSPINNPDHESPIKNLQSKILNILLFDPPSFRGTNTHSRIPIS